MQFTRRAGGEPGVEEEEKAEESDEDGVDDGELEGTVSVRCCLGPKGEGDEPGEEGMEESTVKVGEGIGWCIWSEKCVVNLGIGVGDAEVSRMLNGSVLCYLTLTEGESLPLKKSWFRVCLGREVQNTNL